MKMVLKQKSNKSSFQNRTYNFIRRKIYNIYYQLTTCLMYFKCYVQDVKIEKNCKFRGFTHFFVGNGGAISIGSNCLLFSNQTANNMGLAHSCIFTVSPINEDDTCTLEIGDNCGFSGTTIWCFTRIKIGNNVRCGANTIIMDGDAHFEDSRTSMPKPIILEDNVFLGANVVVKKGVTIGKNAVIGMNSVVTKDIPANSIAVGIPCKVIKKIEGLGY